MDDLRLLSLEELANVPITSVSKRPEPLSRAAAAIFVITSEDIRRSGANSLPEVLRLAPNLQVVRRDSQTYAISARGFNTFEASNKLLVLVDGRSMYTPLHAGVFWDQQQVMLDDIERIEVISGPGGTLYGANAFNGVINVITRHSRETQGGLVNLRYGNVDGSAVGRYGGRLGAFGTYRVYGQGFERDHSVTVRGNSAGDDWQGAQGGFRTDFGVEDDTFTVQGDQFDNSLDSGGDITGKNLLARWDRRLGGGSAVQVQAYYDTVKRETPGLLDELETYDLQGQHSFTLDGRHQIVWGGGHRVSKDEFVAAISPFVLDPTSDTIHLSSLFVQDSIALRDDLTLTIGSKFEYSNFSGPEYMPNVRLGWQVSDTALFWSAISRAVRTPSRIDSDLVGATLERASRGFESEEVLAYELGYRGRPSAQTLLSVSLFYNDYDELRVLATSPATGLIKFDNKMTGHTYGVEIWGDYQAASWWRLSAGFNVLQKRLRLEPGALTLVLHQHKGNDSDYQFSLRSRIDVAKDVELDLALRRVDDLPDPIVPDYLEFDARIGWHATERLELSLAGFNLLDDHHPETGAAAGRREVRRTIYAGARLRF